jgi:prophage DNA circulation protein
MDKIRIDMLGLNLVGLPAVAVAVTGMQFSLVMQARIIATMTFVSREDVDAMMLTMNAVFEPAEEFAADATDDPSVFQSMVALHSAVTRNLIALARPLPRVIQYRFTERMPSLVLANRIYADARRADELRMENKTVHPAFMQSSGRCLSI